MSISKQLYVDFSPYRKNLVEQALSRLLSQHYDKCVLRQFVAAIMDEVQDLYDALIDMQEGRTLYQAEQENLDAIGRIVGEPRAPYQYDESGWMFADRVPQRPDSAGAWIRGSVFSAYVPVNDRQYRMNILARVIKNHTLTASLAEFFRLSDIFIQCPVSYVKTGPMRVRIMVPATISATARVMLAQSRTDQRADSAYMLPYPATLEIETNMTYVPAVYFCADRMRSQSCDSAACAASAPYVQ